MCADLCRSFSRREGFIFESLAVYDLGERGLLADFLGVTCLDELCKGTVYAPSRAYNALSSSRTRGLAGYLVFTNHPEDLLEFFLAKERTIVRDENGCLRTRWAFLSIPFVGRLQQATEERIELEIRPGGCCCLYPENLLPLNRFTGLLVEVLVNLTRIKLHCSRGEAEKARGLLEASRKLIDIMIRHSEKSPGLRRIAAVVEELLLSSDCTER